VEEVDYALKHLCITRPCFVKGKKELHEQNSFVRVQHPMKASFIKYLFPLLRIAFAFFSVSVKADLIEPDLQVSLTKVDPANGKTIWTVPFDRSLRPYRCEVYTNGVVAFLYNKNRGPMASKVVFVDPESGKPVEPFDTREFIYSWQDPLVARSRWGSQGSVEDERGELRLPNRWRTKGVARLSWYNWGPNKIHFFSQTNNLEWTMVLPHGAYNLANWRNILFYKQYSEDKQANVTSDTLFAMRIRATNTLWSFQLPDDLPPRPIRGSDFITDQKSRRFSHFVGKTNIFVFADETLFALSPETGKLEYRHKVSEDKVMKEGQVKMQDAEILEGDENLFLFSSHELSKHELVRFNRQTRSVDAIVRRDMYSNPLPVAAKGALYCFTSP
jgi:outer membrane protein assembly factor BamB